MNITAALQHSRDNNTPISIIGLGRSGLASCRYFTAEGYSVQAFDSSEVSPDVRKELGALGVELTAPCEFACCAESLSNTLAVVSPGVPLEKLSAINFLCVTNELEAALVGCDNPVLIVTGSSGKSTTVSLIAHLLSESGIANRLVGNIGAPLLAERKHWEEGEHIIVEASSFQLESASELTANVAVFTNFSENHLDRHGTLERYFEAKASVFRRLSPSSVAVLNQDDERLAAFETQLTCQVKGFSTSKPDAACAVIQGSGVFGESKIIGPVPAMKLYGEHNVSNLSAALLAASTLSGQPIESLMDGVSSFSPLRHRMQLEELPSGALIMNDSKATTPVAALTAMRALPQELATDRRVRWLFGGRLKPGSWAAVVSLLRELPSIEPILFGEGAEELRKSFGEQTPMFGSLALCLAELSPSLGAEDLLVLSPGAPSFDEFQNFEERGDFFLSRLGVEPSLSRPLCSL